MSDKACRFAVARTKALESTLLQDSDIRDLVACRDYDQAINFIVEKGWGGDSEDRSLAGILKAEMDKTWDDIHAMSMDESIFAPLSYQRLYHNLNAAIKDVVCESNLGDLIYYEDDEISPEQMKQIITEKNFYALPDHMLKVASEAMEVMLHTKDGQLCDSIVDQGALEAMSAAAKATGDSFLMEYTRSLVAVANIRIAIRAAKTGRSKEFLDRAMSVSDAIDITKLKNAAVAGLDSVKEVLISEGYEDAANAIEKSNSAFEIWADNFMMETIKTQQYVSEGPGPVVAYLLARENEIKTVRIILTCKQNKVDDEEIKERVREMYA